MDLEEAPSDDPRWSARLKVLKELIEHHIEEEETTAFDVGAEPHGRRSRHGRGAPLQGAEERSPGPRPLRDAAVVDMAKKTQKKTPKTARKRATRTGEKMGRPPPQRQTQSGKECKMKPRSESQAREYLAAGKLRDQVALIAGGDSGIGRLDILVNNAAEYRPQVRRQLPEGPRSAPDHRAELAAVGVHLEIPVRPVVRLIPEHYAGNHKSTLNGGSELILHRR
jgi:hypothetical protein